MKKIATILCMGAVAAVAYAGVPKSIAQNEYVLNPNLNVETIEALQQEAIAKQAVGEVYTRTFENGNKTWNFALTRSTQYSWGSFYGTYTDESKTEWVPVTMEQWPFYICMFQLWTEDGDDNYWYMLSWPANVAYHQWYGDDPSYDGNDVSTWDFDPVDPAELMNANDDRVHTFKQVDYTNKIGMLPYTWDAADDQAWPIYWSMVGINQYFTNKVTVNGKECIMHVPTGEDDQSRCEFLSFKPSTLDMTAYMRLIAEPVDGGNNIYTNLNWDGQALKVAIVPTTYTFPALSELHVFKDKVLDYDDLYDLGYDNDDMKPVYRYYVAGYGEGISLGYMAGDDGDWAFDTERFGYYTGGVEVPASQVNFFLGSMFFPENADDFEGDETLVMEKYTEAEEEYNGQVIYYCNTYPHDYSLIPSAFKFVPGERGKDGFIAIKARYYVYFQDPTYISFGTVNGFEMRGYDSVGDTHVATYDGMIQYHEDPNDIRGYVEVPSVGTKESGVKSALSEEKKLNVTVENGQIVAPEGSVIYDMNGRRVNGNGTGIYVVRNGKQVAKVLVK